MLRVGLTGGIATGKTTVAAALRDLGCEVLDADKIAHNLIEPGGAAYDAVVREFGAGILGDGGRIDRAALGAFVFGDVSRLARLNAIVHPPVLRAQDEMLAEIARRAPHAIAVVEAALLIEAGYHKKVDCLVVTWCTLEQQLARLTNPAQGRGLTPEQAAQRIAAQMPMDEKRRMSDEVVDCSGSLAYTLEQVTALYARLKRMEAGQQGPRLQHSER